MPLTKEKKERLKKAIQKRKDAKKKPKPNRIKKLKRRLA